MEYKSDLSQTTIKGECKWCDESVGWFVNQHVCHRCYTLLSGAGVAHAEIFEAEKSETNTPAQNAAYS